MEPKEKISILDLYSIEQIADVAAELASSIRPSKAKLFDKYYNSCHKLLNQPQNKKILEDTNIDSSFPLIIYPIRFTIDAGRFTDEDTNKILKSEFNIIMLVNRSTGDADIAMGKRKESRW